MAYETVVVNGVTLTVDDLGGVGKVQVVKMDVGGDGATLPVVGVTPADNFANPADAIKTMALGMVWDGATWDRRYGDSANGADVDVTRLPGSLIGLAEDAVAASGDVGVLGLSVRRDTAVHGVSNDGDYAALGVGPAGALWVARALQRGGGGTIHRRSCAAGANLVSVKASAGAVSWIVATNMMAVDCFLKLYNKASAPAPATDNALLVCTIGLPSKGGLGGGAIHVPIDAFGTGIAYAVTTNGSDTDNTNIATADAVHINLQYV